MSQATQSTMMDGLWRENPALVQLLGLCPLLAVSNNAVNALSLGLASLSVLVLSNGAVALMRRWLREEIRIPMFVLCIATLVTIVERLLHAFFPTLYGVLGLFLPLIVTNCAIIARAEAYASKVALRLALIDGFAMGSGFTAALLAMGSVREVLAHGTWFAGAGQHWGAAFSALELKLFEPQQGLLVMALAPGGFLTLATLIAGKNWLSQRRAAQQLHTQAA
jgi:Na+-translocating ferredoxin:NAD+ oxidoreductase subunit E